MRYTEIASEIMANATALNDEVNAFTQMPTKTKFLAYGCLMACMGQIDLMSKMRVGTERTAGQSDEAHEAIHEGLPAPYEN